MPFLTSGQSRFIGGSRAPSAPVPIIDSELLVNGTFSAWSGDNPTGWTLAGTETGSIYFTESPTGMLRIVGGSSVSIFQIIATAGRWLQLSAELSAVVAGGVRINTNSLIQMAQFTASGANLVILRNTGTVVGLAGLTAGTDVSVDNMSAKHLTLSSLISVKAYASADCDISAAVTRTAGTQAGFAVRVDSPTNPQNFIISYLDGAGNLKTDKCVGGTYTAIAALTGAVAYVAGQRPRIVCSGNNVSIYYNGTQVGSTTAVADAGIVSNKNHGLFSTYAANTFSGYTAA